MTKDSPGGGDGLVRADNGPLVAWEGAPYPPRAWQAAALPVVLDGLRARRPGIVAAVMGAGKSVFLAEVVRMATRRLSGRAIVVCAPSQRLVRQLAATLEARVGTGRVGVYYGSKKQPDRDVVVCCNPSLGSLAEHYRQTGRQVALLVLDEAHKSESKQVREEVPRLAPVCLLGMTATPFRSIPRETVSLFSHVFARYDMADAQRDGVLVPMRVERWSGQASTPVDDACVSMIQAHAKGPGIVSARSIDDAEKYADLLTLRGVESLAIHSQMTRAEQDERLEALRTGAVRCLVHVALLAEGVDLPWLRWLCLRRKVGARVRFLQEVGRVLRVHPGKSEGLILDPHLLLGQHGLETAEALGEALEQAAAAESEADDEDRAPATQTQEFAVSLELLVVHLGTMRDALERAGIHNPRSRRMESVGTRAASASAKQVELIRKSSRLTRHIPKPHRGIVKLLVTRPYALARGEASDLIAVLFAGLNYAREAGADSGVPTYRVQWDPDLVPLPDRDTREAAHIVREVGA